MTDQVPPGGDTPPTLKAFLFYLMRDLVPVGYVESAQARAASPAMTPPYTASPEIAEMAERIARELVSDDSPG